MRSRLTIIPSIRSMIMWKGNRFSETIGSTICFWSGSWKSIRRDRFDIAVRNGANIVSGVTFETAQNDQFYRKALSLAVLDARRKAETIAETLNVQLSKVPFSIAEINDREVIPYQAKTFAMNEASTSLHPGTLEIISRVQAEFSYVSM